MLIVVGGSTKHYAELFSSFDIAGRIATPYAMPYENDKPIYVLRGMKTQLQDYWPEMKAYR